MCDSLFDVYSLVLENITDEHNSTACFRTAEGLGIQNVHVISKFAPMPTSNLISRAAHKWLSIHWHANTQDCISVLRQHKCFISCSDLSEGAVPLANTDWKTKVTPAPTSEFNGVAVVFGNEHRGISALMRRHSDQRFVIPMIGFMQSFNIGVSVGMTLHWAHSTGVTVPNMSPEQQEKVLADWLAMNVKGSDLILKRKGLELAGFSP
eukprot:TRINITY_DN2298_c0_g1_i1.p1 TRINITY_DN2298_c0_g1~~TRINITY_DN2298_c0_g1_i1.p1  ORF type:complete len:208 (+),score=14.26 TRINITY_DN2298_c0_g1_i1:161-784(+)